MQMIVQFQGSSRHYSNPNAVNAQFAHGDGTSVNMTIGVAAESELILGASYEIHILVVQPIQTIEPIQEVTTV